MVLIAIGIKHALDEAATERPGNMNMARDR